MAKNSILFFLLVLSTYHVAGQQYDTAKSFKYSDKVKKVYEVDSLNKSVVVHEFNKKGYLIFSSSKAGKYKNEVTLKYKDTLLVERKTIFKNDETESVDFNSYTYVGNRLISSSYTADSQNKLSDNYHNVLNKKITYDNKNRMLKITSEANKGRIENSDFFYDRTDGLTWIKTIDEDTVHTVEKEYIINNNITLNTYQNKNIKPSIIEVWNLNDKKMVLHYTKYLNDEKIKEEEYTYKDKSLSSSICFDKYYGLTEHYFNSYGDIEKTVNKHKNFEYKYIYNKYGDQIETRSYSDGKLINVIRTEYEYWQ